MTSHTPYLVLGVCGLLLLGVGMGNGGQPTSALLDAHLRQAQQLMTPTPAQEASALPTVQQELLARTQWWEERLRHATATVPLLQGLPDKVWQRATASSHDSGQSQAWLATDAALSTVLALLAQRSPEVQAARENLRATLSRFGQAAYLEELLAQFRAFVREVDTRVGPQTHKEMPEKTFAFPSLLALKGQIVDAEAGLAELRYQRTLRLALNETARTYFEAQYTQQARHILQENRALFSQMEILATARLGVGQVMQADSLRAQTELAMVETQLVTVERQHFNALARMNAALLLPLTTRWAPLPATDLRDAEGPIEQVLARTRATHQDVLLARQEVELMEVMIRMAESDVFPRASQGYSQLAPSLGAEAGPTRQMLSAFPERPESNANRANFGANVAYLDELRGRLRQAREMQRVALAQAEFQAQDAHFRIDVARRERQTLSTLVIPKAHLALETVRVNYHAAKVPFIEYLDAARSYLKDTLALEKARMEHNQMLVELQDRMGLAAPQIVPDKK